MLETLEHSQNSFVTLTYREADMPLSQSGSPTLEPVHLRNFLKRLRWRWNTIAKEISNDPQQIKAARLRFYACGEYGDESWRPHYHVALFGYPSCRYAKTRYSRNGPIQCCVQCHVVHDEWGYGGVSLGNLETASAQYVAGYVTKKLNKVCPRLGDRHPEFSRMSLRPGIGAGAMWEVADALMKFNLEESEADVPSALRHGKRLMPLGKYLRRILRERCGLDPKAPQASLDAMAEELRAMYEAADAATAAPGFSRFKSAVFKNMVIDAGSGERASIEAKARIFKQRKTL